MSTSLLPSCQCCSINTTGGNFFPFSVNSGHNCVFICSTVATNKMKDLWEECSIGFVFGFYLAALKWITAALSFVCQALRDSQAERSRCESNAISATWISAGASSPTGLLSSPPSITLSWPITLLFSLIHVPFLSVCLSLLLPFLFNTSFSFFLLSSQSPQLSLYRCRCQCSRRWF